MNIDFYTTEMHAIKKKMETEFQDETKKMRERFEQQNQGMRDMAQCVNSNHKYKNIHYSKQLEERFVYMVSQQCKDEWVSSILTSCEAWPFVIRFPCKYSRGNRQRVGRRVKCQHQQDMHFVWSVRRFRRNTAHSLQMACSVTQ